jgi:HAD superfamily hydrolase (TIGR01509 family)
MKHSAVIFDLDGLLLDTERPALRAFDEACECMRLTLDRSIYLQCIGTTEFRTREILVEALGEAALYDELRRAWGERYALQGPASLKDGAVELLQTMNRSGVPIALATSTFYEKAMEKLRRAEILDYFNAIVTGDQVARGKPDPEIYLQAAMKLNALPGLCVAIEDSDNGVRAAHAAGMTVIQVPDLAPPADDVRALGHLVLESLRDVESRLESL